MIGKTLVVRRKSYLLSGAIVETEAYDGKIDEAAHSFRGKTPSNSVMFGRGGKLYVYFTYGMHFCSNVVTGADGDPCAVLLRAIEPLSGIEIMSKNRFDLDNISHKERFNLTSGPGKLTKAMGINKLDNGKDLTGNEIYILDSEPIPGGSITVTKRIGISKSVELPWRFYITGNPYISRK